MLASHQYCTFQNNSATDGGGAMWVYGLTGDVSITYCTFQNNSANGGIGGGAVWLYGPTGNVSIAYCTFTKNRAIIGAAVYFIKMDLLTATSLGHLVLQDVVIKDNHCSRGGAITFDGVKVDIFGNTPTGSQFLSNSAQGAIQGQNGFLLLHGNITFTENRGVNGGAISLSNDVSLYLYKGCRVVFSRNAATGFGGAIYNDWGQKDTKHLQLCIIRFILQVFISPAISPSPSLITMHSKVVMLYMPHPFISVVVVLSMTMSHNVSILMS